MSEYYFNGEKYNSPPVNYGDINYKDAVAIRELKEQMFAKVADKVNAKVDDAKNVTVESQLEELPTVDKSEAVGKDIPPFPAFPFPASKKLPIISIPIEQAVDQYKCCLEWYFLFKEYSVFLANESMISCHLETARRFFKNISFDLDKNEVSSGDISYDDMSEIMLHLEMFAEKKQTFLDNDALKNDKKYWLAALETHQIPTTGRLCDHIIQNGNSVVERQTKKMITLYGKKMVSSWWDEYRGEPIDF